MIPGKSARRIRRVFLLITLAALTLAAPGDAWAQFDRYGGLRPAPATGLAGWLLGQQAFFYRALARMLRAAKTNGSAYWGLMGVWRRRLGNSRRGRSAHRLYGE
jgi:hypothetical protein